MNMMDAVKNVFSNYAKFDGRARRSEYWYFFLFNMLVSVVISALAKVTGVHAISYLGSLYSLAALIPGLAVAFRRLHDTGKSGWFLLFAFIPLVGAILLIVWMAQDGKPGENQYGYNPKEVAE